MTHKEHGDFELPKGSDMRDLREILKANKQRQEWEKYMNPKGIKPTITSNFPKEGPEIDFVSHTT